MGAPARAARGASRTSCFQMLLRASNAVGYTNYPDNVVAEFVYEAAAQGIDLFRIFDSLNWLPNMQVAMEAVRKTGTRLRSGHLLHRRHPRSRSATSTPSSTTSSWRRNWSAWARTSSRSRTWPGCASRTPPRSWCKALREEIGIPIHFHTHDTSGINAASILKAADAGVDIADGAIASMSGMTSQPNLNSIVAALRTHDARHRARPRRAEPAAPITGRPCATYYAPFETGPKAGTAEVYLHEMPGGQYTNLRSRPKSLGLGARWHEIARTYAEVNMAFGDIVKVTPSSKVVGDMAMFLVSHGMTMEQFEQLGPDHNLTLPNSVVEMFMGSLGEPDGGWPKTLQKIILRGAQAASAAGRARICRRSISTRRAARAREEDRPRAVARRTC